MSDSFTDTWGESKLDGEGNYPRTFKIKQGKTSDEETHNVFRVLPAMMRQIKTGKVAEFHKIHYGYKVPGRTPDKSVAKPFVCTENMDFQTKMITQRCPECENIRAKKEELEETGNSFDMKAKQRVREWQAAGRSKADIAKEIQRLASEKKALLLPLQDWLRSHNQERKWHVNVKSLETGGLGDIHISNTLWKEIKSLIKKMSDAWKGDSLAPNRGFWVDIIRTGNGSGVMPGSAARDKVEVVTELLDPANPMGGSKPKLAPLTKDDADRSKTACRDVADPAPALVLDVEIIEMLVNCDESPDEVQRILNLRQVANDPKQDDAPQKASRSLQEASHEQVGQGDPEDDNAALEAALGAVGGIPNQDGEPADEEVVVTRPIQPVRGQSSGKALKDMSTEDFLSQFEDPEASPGRK